jgi:transposase
MDKDSLSLLLSQGLSLERIATRFGKHPSTVSYWIEKHGLRAANRDKHLAKGGIERSRLEELVQAGMTIAEIAQELGRSKATVRHWLGRYGLRTKNSVGRRPRADAAREARDAGLLTVRRVCAEHGETEFVLEGRGYYRCKRCRADGVARHRRKLKAILVQEAGGRCVVCGYDRHPRALEFHHLDPDDKRLALSANGVTLSLDVLRAEAQKCVLLCSNCHAEVEDGVISVRSEFPDGPVGGPIHGPG